METFGGSMIANNAASLDGRLRTLVVGVEDALGDAALNHRKTSTVLFQNRRWLDKFTIPGQYITITVGWCKLKRNGIL